MRTEHDFLGEMQVEDNVYYGIQTLRAILILVKQLRL